MYIFVSTCKHTHESICVDILANETFLWSLKHENKPFLHKLVIPCIKLCLLTNK